MLIIGCDYHPSLQQIAFVDTDTGELGERRQPPILPALGQQPIWTAF
jgi:hypothetical protein